MSDALRSFVTAVLTRVGNSRPIRQFKTVDASSHWATLASINVETADGQRYQIACREHPASTPIDRIDFLDMDSDPRRSLIIVYPGAAATVSRQVPDRYIVGQEWRSVTHVYWGEDHPFGTLAEVSPPNRTFHEATEPIGGRRLDTPPLAQPRFSIVTIVFNGADTIEQTIQSVLHNRDEDVEYIVVDGGSTDDTLTIINRYGEHLDFWVSEPDKGIYDALNKAISLCHGEIIGAIHSNDLYAMNALAHIKQAVDDRPDAELFFGRICYVGPRRRWTGGKSIETTRELVMFGNFNHPTCFVRRSAYQRLGKFDPRYSIAGDYDLGIRFWKSGVQFHYVDALISYFRLGGTSQNLYRNQWQRHRIRIASGESTIWSLSILVMVIGNYYLKRPVRWLKDLLARRFSR